MRIDTLTRGMMIASCLEIIEVAEESLDKLLGNEPLEDVCPECAEKDDSVYKWLNSN